MHLTRPALLAVLLAATVAGQAAPLKTDAAKSSIGVTFKAMNVPVDAKFKKFSAQIDYDPAKPDAAKAVVDVETASLDVGEAEMNKEVVKKEWFNAPQFPKANFTSTSIKANGPGKLAVTGKLTIKGRVMDVSFPLAVKADGARQVFEGALPIKRLAYSIGEGEWKDTSMVADDVVIKFQVTAQP
jgi:polyisoprenoid-binding protein YceI